MNDEYEIIRGTAAKIMLAIDNQIMRFRGEKSGVFDQYTDGQIFKIQKAIESELKTNPTSTNRKIFNLDKYIQEAKALWEKDSNNGCKNI